MVIDSESIVQAPGCYKILKCIRSSRPEAFCKKAVLRNITKFSGKHLCQRLFFNKVTVLRPATLLKKVSGTGVFLRILRNFQKHLFYRTPPDECFYKIRRLEDRFTGIIGDSAVDNSTIEGRVGTLIWSKIFEESLFVANLKK